MAAFEISQVSSARDRDAFIKFPWRIYRNDPAWVPPLIIERREFLDRSKHPFYQHGDAALFLARRNGEIVGRIERKGLEIAALELRTLDAGTAKRHSDSE